MNIAVPWPEGMSIKDIAPEMDRGRRYKVQLLSSQVGRILDNDSPQIPQLINEFRSPSQLSGNFLSQTFQGLHPSCRKAVTPGIDFAENNIAGVSPNIPISTRPAGGEFIKIVIFRIDMLFLLFFLLGRTGPLPTVHRGGNTKALRWCFHFIEILPLITVAVDIASATFL